MSKRANDQSPAKNALIDGVKMRPLQNCAHLLRRLGVSKQARTLSSVAKMPELSPSIQVDSTCIPTRTHEFVLNNQLPIFPICFPNQASIYPHSLKHCFCPCAHFSLSSSLSHSRQGQRALEDIVGPKSVAMSQAVREQHCRDESYHADTDGLFPPQV